MNAKYLIPVLLVSVLSGCASGSLTSSNDPIRQKLVSDMERAKQDGTFPMTEKQFVYPNWPELATAQPTVAP